MLSGLTGRKLIPLQVPEKEAIGASREPVELDVAMDNTAPHTARVLSRAIKVRGAQTKLRSRPTGTP
jgi:hypothetical protein